jgi:hypothetical protein
VRGLCFCTTFFFFFFFFWNFQKITHQNQNQKKKSIKTARNNIKPVPIDSPTPYFLTIFRYPPPIRSIPTPLRGRSDARRLMKQVARHAPKNVKIAVFCCQKGVLGEKIEKSAKRGAKIAENGPKMAENVPKIAPKMAENAPRMAENAPKMAPGMAENAPKMAERATKMAPGSVF